MNHSATGNVLRYPLRFVIFGLVYGLAFSACALLAYPSRTGGALVAAAFVLFASPGLYLALDCVFTTIWVDADSVRGRYLLKGRVAVKWGEVKRIEWSPGFVWFVLHTTDGAKLRVSAGMRGVRAFANALLDCVDAERFSQAARERLLAVARGNAPPLWD